MRFSELKSIQNYIYKAKKAGLCRESRFTVGKCVVKGRYATKKRAVTVTGDCPLLPSKPRTRVHAVKRTME